MHGFGYRLPWLSVRMVGLVVARFSYEGWRGLPGGEAGRARSRHGAFEARLGCGSGA